MRFLATPLRGSFVIELEPHRDARGLFARTFCAREFGEAGLNTQFVQMNLSCSTRRGTLRGMHFQRQPYGEVKFVRCIAGALYDVIVDLRPDSPTFLKWFGQELTSENRLQMYVPVGFAHGFLTLSDKTEIQYLVSNFYAPDHERSIHHNDPTIGIVWPAEVTEVSDRDATARNFDPAFHGTEDFRGLITGIS